MLGLELVLLVSDHDVEVVVVHQVRPSSLPVDGEQAVGAQVDQVGDVGAEGLALAQA